MQLVPNTLTHERVAVFCDYANARRALRLAGQQIDLVALRDYLAQGRHLVEAFVYLATHPQADRHEANQAAIYRLRQNGFLVHTQPGRLLPNGQVQGDMALDMALDLFEYVARARPDIVVLVTGEGRLAPLAARLRRYGVRVEVASTPQSVSPELRALANGFVDLAQIGERVNHLPLAEAHAVRRAAPEQDGAPDDAGLVDLALPGEVLPEEALPGQELN